MTTKRAKAVALASVLAACGAWSASCSVEPDYTPLQGTWREVGATRVMYLDGAGGGLLDPRAAERGKKIGAPCTFDLQCNEGTCTETGLSVDYYESRICSRPCDDRGPDTCPSGTSCSRWKDSAYCMTDRFARAAVPVQVSVDPFLKFQFGTKYGTLWCWTCELVEDGKKISCKSKWDWTAEQDYPTNCEFERIGDDGPPDAGAMDGGSTPLKPEPFEEPKE